ncbi:hypothetical protein [Flavobacterium sp. U410]
MYHDEVNKLAQLIKSSLQIKNEKHIKDKEVADADNIWNASLFLSKVLHKASYNFSFTKSDFQKFKVDFEQTYGVEINDKSLFDRYWLREILGQVKLSSAIDSFCYRFDEITDFREELKFICKLQEDNKPERFESNKKFSKEYLSDKIVEYEKANTLSLNIDGVLFKRWSSEKDNEIGFSDMQSYFKPYLEYWDDFIFLNALRKYLSNRKEIKIKISDFTDIHFTHKNAFSKTPTIEKLISQKLLIKIADDYKIEFYNSKPRYWSGLENKISAYLWQLLLDDSTFQNDNERLINWTYKVHYWESWPNPYQFLVSSSSKRLLDASFTCIIDEKDLEGCDDEFKKVKLEGEHRNEIFILSERGLKRDNEFSLNNDDLFQILNSLESWEDRASRTYLYDQTTRNEIGFLIYLVVVQDEEYHRIENESDEDDYKIEHCIRIKDLLRAGINKPYLVWKVSRVIRYHRPEVIPHLLFEKDICSMCFIILDQLEYNAEHRGYFESKIWKESILFTLKQLIKENASKQEIATLIFNVFQVINKEKYKIYNYQQHPKSSENLNSREYEYLTLLENYKINSVKFSSQNTDYLLPYIYKELSDLFINLKIKPKYNNGTIRFPMLQWDGIIWLLKISTYWKFKNDLTKSDIKIEKLVNEFYKSYLESIEKKEITKYNFFDDKVEVGTPLWSEKIETVGLLDWLFPVYFINKEGSLNSFLSPRIEIDKSKGRYDEVNRFSVQKLRTHIGVLLQLLRKVIETPTPYSFEEKKILEIKRRIEDQIFDYLSKYSDHNPEADSIDLFGYSEERQFQNSDKEALIPQLFRAINWFSDKEKVVNLIMEKGDLTKILELLENSTSEGTRKLLLEKVKNINIREFLESFNWIPEIENVLIKISRYPELIEQAEEAVTYWEEKVLQRKSELNYKELLFTTKLLLAYFKNDISSINTIDVPDKENNYDSRKLPYSVYKSFYSALIHIQSEPEKAYNKFNDLVKYHPDYYTFALNRMVAKVNWAEKEGKIDLYSEAYEEWREYRKVSDDSSFELKDKTESLTVLDLLNKLEKFDDFEKVFRNLELPVRMDPNILKLRVENLVEQKKLDEASILKDTAYKYHQSSSETPSEFLTEIDNLISGIDNIDELKSFYHKIFSSTPNKLVRIIPEDINDKEKLDEFIVNEVVTASNKMLEKIKSISEIKNEDKYNDIMEVLIDARINPWGWHVGAQSRGGYSAPKDGRNSFQPGERDLPIMNCNNQAIQICEAFIYRGSTTAKEHINKLFDYHHKKEEMTIIVYDTGEVKGKTFDQNWGDYKKNIVPKTKYPSGFEFESIIEVTNDYKMKLSAVKIAKSNHKSGTILHHIFININYKTT